jgi:hypothetical protein
MLTNTKLRAKIALAKVEIAVNSKKQQILDKQAEKTAELENELAAIKQA